MPSDAWNATRPYQAATNLFAAITAKATAIVITVSLAFVAAVESSILTNLLSENLPKIDYRRCSLATIIAICQKSKFCFSTASFKNAQMTLY